MEPINPFQVQDGGKTAGMMSYFFVLGWSLAYFGYHQNNKTSLSSYQLLMGPNRIFSTLISVDVGF